METPPSSGPIDSDWNPAWDVSLRRSPQRDLVRIIDQWWHQVHDQAAGRLPRREDFRPEAFPAALPNIWLIDIREEGGEIAYFIRLWGTGCTRTAGIDCTGRRVGTTPPQRLDPEIARKWPTLYRQVMLDRKPLRFTSRLEDQHKNHIRVEVGLYPLADESGAVSMIMCIFDLERPSYDVTDRPSSPDG